MTDPARPISAAIDETVAQLDALQAVGRTRRENWLAGLRGVVARLDAPTLSDEAEPAIDRPERDAVRRRQEEPEEPFVALPQRSQPARGGYYGPKVEAKLRAIALEKCGW